MTAPDSQVPPEPTRDSSVPGHFDEARREYVITDPDTPRPWINYLFNRRLGAFVSQGAGGCCWLDSPRVGRLSRYRFLNLPEDRPGFYDYIRQSDGVVWSPSFHPCRTPLQDWSCRHGMGYTEFHARHGGVEARYRLFIAPADNVLIADLTLRHVEPQGRPASLFVANYLEFGLLEFWKEMVGWMVLRNQTHFLYDPALPGIRYVYRAYEAERTPAVLLSMWPDPEGFACDRDAFIGRGRSEANPEAMERGCLGGSELPGGGRGIGSLGRSVRLEPGAQTRLFWVLAAEDEPAAAQRLVQRYRQPDVVDQAWCALGRDWQDRLGRLQVEVPDADMRCSLNAWNPLAIIVNARHDRGISTEAPCFSTGMNYRDHAQHNLALAAIDPDHVRATLRQILSHQCRDGRAMDGFIPGKPTPAPTFDRCDNNVWPPMTVHQYVCETGDLAFLGEELPFHDGGQASVYEHLLLGLRQVVRDVGEHGLPLLASQDWDDHLAILSEPGAESVMTAQNWCYAATLLAELAGALGREDDQGWLAQQREAFGAALNRCAWDGEWYRQVLFRGGKTALGSQAREENQLYLNTQSWAVISGTATAERARQCMDSVARRLDTPNGIKLLTPPYTGIPTPRDPLLSNGPGLGENGGIFVHANCWAIMAEAMLGRGDQAFRYYRQCLPSVLARRVGPARYLNEPYVHSSHILAEPDGRAGMANISWLSGTMNWMYLAATQYILGVRPTLEGLRLRPCLPSPWTGATVLRRYRGATYRIVIARGGQGGGPRVVVDGVVALGGLIAPVAAGREVTVEVNL